jgi:hypothetical protein
VLPNRIRLRPRHHRRKGSSVGLLDRLQAPEVLQQAACSRLADAWHFAQFGGPVAHLAAFAVESYSEAVSFVAHHLNDVQNRRTPVEHDGFMFLSENVDNLFPFGN